MIVKQAGKEAKASNPKDIIGSDKMPFHLWPETATILGTLGLLEGALKYGRSNWRAVGVKASIYQDAAKRHINAWFEGEDIAPDSGLPHLGHALACLAILVDAQAKGYLTDDRMLEGGYHRLLAEMTPHVKRLKEKYAHLNPYHYTRADNEGTKETDGEEPGNRTAKRESVDCGSKEEAAEGDGWNPRHGYGKPTGCDCSWCNLVSRHSGSADGEVFPDSGTEYRAESSVLGGRGDADRGPDYGEAWAGYGRCIQSIDPVVRD